MISDTLRYGTDKHMVVVIQLYRRCERTIRSTGHFWFKKDTRLTFWLKNICDDISTHIFYIAYIVNLEGWEKRPWLGWHSKYRTPFTEPSFLPVASSSSTPIHVLNEWKPELEGLNGRCKPNQYKVKRQVAKCHENFKMCYNSVVW